MGATLGQRNNVVDFLHRRQPARGFAVLTQRVLGDVGGADLPLRVPVAFVDLRVPLKLPVTLVGLTLVGLAVRAIS